MFLDNKYTRWYHGIVVKAKARDKVTEYTERHHIIPKAFGGGNNAGNLVNFTFREHFLAHWLLTKMVEGRDRRRMWSALVMMRRVHSGRIVAAWQYDLAKVAGRNAFFGRRHTDKTKARLREVNLGHVSTLRGIPRSEKTRQKISATRISRGIGHTVESRAKIGRSLLGNKHLLGHQHTQETREKMRASHIGITHTEEAKRKIGVASRARMLGTKHTEEHKRKIGEASKRMHAARRLAKQNAGHSRINPNQLPLPKIAVSQDAAGMGSAVIPVRQTGVAMARAIH